MYFFCDAQTPPAGSPSVTLGASKGSLIGVTYGTTSASSTGCYYGYDVLGRAKESYQRTDGQNYHFQYEYNRAGGMTKETYQSNRAVIT